MAAIEIVVLPPTRCEAPCLLQSPHDLIWLNTVHSAEIKMCVIPRLHPRYIEGDGHCPVCIKIKRHQIKSVLPAASGTLANV